MKPTEIVKILNKENPALLRKVPEQKAARIILEAFLHVGRQLNKLTEGNVKIPRFGNFRVRQVKRERNGESTTVKIVTFRAAKGKKGGPKVKSTEPSQR